MATMNISLPDELKQFVDAQVAEHAYGSASEYLRELIRKQRDVGLYMKLEQIRETGAELVISPCHNCWDAIRDLEEEYHIHIDWSFLKPLLLKMVIVPEHLKPKDEDDGDEE